MTVDHADELWQATVRDTSGRALTLASLFADAPALLLWVRHFG